MDWQGRAWLSYRNCQPLLNTLTRPLLWQASHYGPSRSTTPSVYMIRHFFKNIWSTPGCSSLVPTYILAFTQHHKEGPVLWGKYHWIQAYLYVRNVLSFHRHGPSLTKVFSMQWNNILQLLIEVFEKCGDTTDIRKDASGRGANVCINIVFPSTLNHVNWSYSLQVCIWLVH